MKITLLPTTVTPGAGGRGQFLTSLLIDDAVAIDAGGLGLIGDLDAQGRVRHVFLSHSHLDHVASLPLFLDTVYDPEGDGVTIYAGEPTLDSLRRDLFNDRVWPDFFRFSGRGRPFVRAEPLEPGRPVDVGHLRLTPIAVDHAVPTLGFLVEGPDGAVAIPSDTGPTEAFWRAARAVEPLRAVFLEASFPDALAGLADVSKHLTPAGFAGEARKLDRPVPFVAVHIKPRYYDRVVAELRALGGGLDVRIGDPGLAYEF